MRILAIGDFEGKFPRKLKSFIKKEKPDLIVYIGDFPNRDKTRKIEWSLWNKKLKKDEYRREFLKRTSGIIDKEFISGKYVMKNLAEINLPILFVFGNHDVNERNGKYPLLKYSKEFKNMKYLHKKSIKIKGVTFVGHGGYRGFASKQDLFRKITKEERKTINKIKFKYRKELKRAFSKHKNVVFVTHDVPYNIKFDEIHNPASPINGKHIGDDVYREFVIKKKPILHICGHMHEYQGKTKLGETTVVIPGFGQKGKCAIIDLPKLKVKFIKL